MANSEENERPSSKPNRTKLNFTIDFLILVLMLLMISTGIIIRYILPPGTGGREGGTSLLLWGMNRHDFGDLHTYFAIAFIGTLLLHLALHWTWVCRATLRIVYGSADTKKLTPQVTTRYGLGLLLLTTAVIGGFVWSLSPVTVTVPNEQPQHDANEISRRQENSPTQRLGAQSHQKSTVINGSMTLTEVSAQTGVSVKTLRHDLHLPSSTSPNEQLGRLKRRYGFEIEDVRHVAATKGE